MPGRYCAIAFCKNNQIALKKADNNDVIFHSFPVARDLVSCTTQKEWIHLCKKSDKFNVKNSTVCSIHFTKDDYERDLENELLGLPLRRRLKKTAVPTLNLGTNIDKENKNGAKGAQAEILLKAIKLEHPGPSTSKCPTVESIPEGFETYSVQHETDFDIEQKFFLEDSQPSDNERKFFLEDSQPSDNINYKHKYEQLLKKYNDLKLQSRTKTKNLNSLMNYYKSKHYKKSRKVENAEEILNMVLTKNQIALLSKRKKNVIWTPEEISAAFTISYYSKDCYLFLRDKLKYPLPALSTLRRWL